MMMKPLREVHLEYLRTRGTFNFIRKDTIATDVFPEDPFIHYEIACLNHIIDVVSLSVENYRDFSKKNYEDYVEGVIKPFKEQALNELIKSIGWIVIPLTILIYFQRQINRRKTTPIGFLW